MVKRKHVLEISSEENRIILVKEAMNSNLDRDIFHA